jgi:phosphohistidine phosphatase SixA
MKLIILRHGHALNRNENTCYSDSKRPLSSIGMDQIKKSALKISGLLDNEPVIDIYHSSKLRALQSARIVYDTLSKTYFSKGPGRPQLSLEQAEGLCPEDNPDTWYNIIMLRRDPLIIVSHLPFVELLAFKLTKAAGYNEIPAFYTSTALYLEKNRSNGYNHISDNNSNDSDIEYNYFNIKKIIAGDI